MNDIRLELFKQPSCSKHTKRIFPLALRLGIFPAKPDIVGRHISLRTGREADKMDIMTGLFEIFEVRPDMIERPDGNKADAHLFSFVAPSDLPDISRLSPDCRKRWHIPEHFLLRQKRRR